MTSGPPTRRHQDEVKGSLGSGLLRGWRFWSAPLRCWQNLGLFLAGFTSWGCTLPVMGPHWGFTQGPGLPSRPVGWVFPAFSTLTSRSSLEGLSDQVRPPRDCPVD